jgi:HipA-like protein
MAFKRPIVSPNTFFKEFTTAQRCIDRHLPSRSLADAVKIRDWIVANKPPNAAKRLLILLAACCEWSPKSRFIDKNPFEGMSAEVKVPKSSAMNNERALQMMGEARRILYGLMVLNTPGKRPISLSLPLQQDVYQGDRVYNFFDNLLPDSDRTRAKIQARFQIPGRQPFDLLTAIGGDCVGAIQLCPIGTMPNSIEGIQSEPLSTDEIAAMLSGDDHSPLGMVESTNEFRISIAGAQEKTALLWHQNQWCRPLGATPTSHIFKLPIGLLSNNNIDLRESCENEWLCLEIAKAFRLATANAEIQQFNDVKVLIVEQFDRRWSRNGQQLLRLPQEDRCQALGRSPSLKYQADGGPGIVEIMPPLQNLLINSNSKFIRPTDQ